ncbi:hypothetical protein Tco_0201601 [Tanacetum coccineum]
MQGRVDECGLSWRGFKSLGNVSSLIPQGQKASDYDNSDPVPPRQNVVPSAEKTDSSKTMNIKKAVDDSHGSKKPMQDELHQFDKLKGIDFEESFAPVARWKQYGFLLPDAGHNQSFPIYQMDVENGISNGPRKMEVNLLSQKGSLIEIIQKSLPSKESFVWIKASSKSLVENGIIELYFVRTEYQLVDMFIKVLPGDRFKYLVRRIGMRCLTPADLEVLSNETA